jgi:large subunit ribosomal protein L21
VFAIIQSGGRQVKVVPGEVVTVDRINAEPGQEVSIDQVLLLEKDGGEVLAGAPFVFMKKRRKGSRKTRGHRATYTRVRITGIEA